MNPEHILKGHNVADEMENSCHFFFPRCEKWSYHTSNCVSRSAISAYDCVWMPSSFECLGVFQKNPGTWAVAWKSALLRGSHCSQDLHKIVWCCSVHLKICPQHAKMHFTFMCQTWWRSNWDISPFQTHPHKFPLRKHVRISWPGGFQPLHRVLQPSWVRVMCKIST